MPDALLCTDGTHVIRCHTQSELTGHDVSLEGFSRGDHYWILTSDSRLLSIALDDGSIEDHTEKLPSLDNAYWVWTSQHQDILVGIPGRILRYNGTSARVFDVPENEHGKVHSATISPDGELWVTSHLGLHKLGNETSEFCALERFACSSLWDLLADENRVLWIPSRKHLIHFDGDHIDFIAGPDFGATFSYKPLLIDSEKNLWLTLHFRGVMCVNASGSVVFPIEDTPGVSWPSGVVQDKTGSFWFIGVRNGILRYDPQHLHVVQSGYMEASMLGDDGKVRVTAASKGLLEYDGSGVKQLCSSIPGRCVALFRQENGNLFIVSPYGLFVYDVMKSVVLSVGEMPSLQGAEGLSVRCMTSDWEGGLWMSTADMLSRFVPSGMESYSCVELGLADGRPVLFRDSTATVWIMTTGGSPVLHYGKKGFSTFLETLGEWLGNARISCLCEDGEGNVWMGSSMGHLARCHRTTGEMECVMQFEDEASICDICIDRRGVKWISTTAGLVVCDGRNSYRMSEASLLPSRSAVATYELGENITDDTELVIVTELGLCEYRPNRNVRPDVCVTRIVSDKTYDQPERIVVSEARPVLSVYLTAVNMKPGPLKYQVRMFGHCDDWTATWKEEFHYEDLPVGTYRFEASAIDQDLMGSDVVAVDIEITPDTRDILIAELEGELRGAQDFAANIIRSIDDAIIVLNADGRITTSNVATIKLLRCTKDDLIGEPAETLFHEKSVSLFDAQGIATLIAERHFRSRELDLRVHDGSAVPVMFSASCMYDSDSTLQGFVFVASDISEYKSLQTQMLQNQKMESLGVLAGGIAHDFNNLLGVMLGNIDLVYSDLEKDSQHYEYLSDVVAAGEQAAKLCSEMLTYSGRGQSFREALDLSTIVRRNAGLLKSSVSRKIVIEYNLEEASPTVLGDEVQIMQIVLNLVINAAEAIGDKEGVISLSTRSGFFAADDLECAFNSDAPQPGRYVLLEAGDSGCGIDPEILPRIFEPFFTTKFTGRGLGLSAMHGIVKSLAVLSK
jgi:PAS domain S-box-containing protein